MVDIPIGMERRIERARRTARVLAAIACALLAGAACFIIHGITGGPFPDWWFGGVYALPIGFALGLLWQEHAGASGIRENRDLHIVAAIPVAALPLMAQPSPGSGLFPGT